MHVYAIKANHCHAIFCRSPFVIFFRAIVIQAVHITRRSILHSRGIITVVVVGFAEMNGNRAFNEKGGKAFIFINEYVYFH